MGKTGAFITSLTLSQFRTYSEARLRLTPDRCFVVLFGENGAGKTGALEAVSLLSPGRGMRRAALSDMRMQGSDRPWAVATEVLCGDETIRVGTGEDPVQSGRRTVRLDGETVKSNDSFGTLFPIIWLTPSMDRLFMEAPSGRRRFLDRLVLSLYKEHGRHVNGYEKAMRERNKLLESPRLDETWCAALERQMAEYAAAIAHARADYTSQLAGIMADMDEAAFPRVDLALDGVAESLVLSDLSVTEVEDRMQTLYKEVRDEDHRRGRTGIGPHRTDMLVTYQAKAMTADQCSTGEQKAMLISIILAGARLTSLLTGQTPIMLLDEVAAHLDKNRRRALFETLASLGGQIWLTGTDSAMFNSLGDHAHWVRVTPGQFHLETGPAIKAN